MHIEDVLSAVGTGLWRWENAAEAAPDAGEVIVDPRAARLLGIAPAEEGVRDGPLLSLSLASVRARFHVVDFVEFQTAVTRALAEGTVAEGLLRVVNPDGSVLRTVRLRTASEVVDPGDTPDGAAAKDTTGTTGTTDKTITTGTTGTTGTADTSDTTDTAGTDHAGASGRVRRLTGLICEVPEPPPGSSSAPPAGVTGTGESQAGGAGPAGSSATTPAATGDWRRHREAFLLDAGRALAEAHSTAEVLRVTASLAMPGFSPDGLAVFGVKGDRLSVIGHHGQAEGADRAFMDMPLSTDYPAAEVVRTGQAIYLATPEQYRARFPASWPLAAPFGRQSWAFLPLTVADRPLGAWMAGFSHPVSFTPDERAVLTTVARMLAQALTRTTLRETERELTVGLQRTMRPIRRPHIPGMALAARYIPTGGGLHVGGDWYDVIPLPSGRTALVIGDVQGHDMRSAAIMTQLRVALRAYAAEGHRPDAVLSRASRFLNGIRGSSAESREPDKETGVPVGEPSGGPLGLAPPASPRPTRPGRHGGEQPGGQEDALDEREDERGDERGDEQRQGGEGGEGGEGEGGEKGGESGTDWQEEEARPGERTGTSDAEASEASEANRDSRASRDSEASGDSGDSRDSRASEGTGDTGGSGGVEDSGLGPAGEERYATCLYVEVDPASGAMEIARAGHPNPAVRMADGSLLVRSTVGGLPLGIDPDSDYPTTRLVLEPNETLLLYTDGLVEAGGHDLDTGWERIRRVFEAHAPHAGGPETPEARATTFTGAAGEGPRSEALERLADGLVQAVHGPPSHHLRGPLVDRRDDDIALLMLAYAEGAGARGGEEGTSGSSRRSVVTIAQSQPDRIAEARDQLRSLLFDWHEGDQVDGAVLMLSEMLTNVLVHTDDDALMVVEVDGERGHRKLRVEVSDCTDELPHRRQPGELASSGRGLVLLEMLAGSWGVDPQGEGKRIWFELSEDAGPPEWED